METRTRNRVIAFRVTPAERRKIEAKVRQSGLSQQEYLLHAALETPILVVEDLKPLLSELRAWGRNLNQLTVLAHQGHIRSADLREATGRAGQGLRGGQRTPDRGRAGGNPWRRAVSSVRRSRPPAPWAASCGTWPRSRNRGHRRHPLSHRGQLHGGSGLSELPGYKEPVRQGPAAPGSTTTPSPSRPRSASHRRRPIRSPRSWRSGSSPAAKCWWLPTSTGPTSTPTW